MVEDTYPELLSKVRPREYGRLRRLLKRAKIERVVEGGGKLIIEGLVEGEVGEGSVEEWGEDWYTILWEVSPGVFKFISVVGASVCSPRPRGQPSTS